MIELLIENIGKVKLADIKLDTITIVAGVNNTGKSTISKILYSGMKPSSEIGRERVCVELSDEVVNCLENLSEKTKEKVGSLIDLIYTELKNKRFTLLQRRIEELEVIVEENGDDNDNLLVSNLKINLLIKDTDILKNYLEDDLGNLLNEDMNREKRIKIKRDDIELIDYSPKNNNEDNKTLMRMGIVRNNEIYNVLYISTPYILDKIKYSTNFLTMIEEDLMNDFQRNFFSRGVINLSKTKSTRREIEEIIENIIGGNLYLKTPQEIVYKMKKGEEVQDVSLNNTATGIKSLGILLQLLSNASIKENSILILDEPEVHLHPEWQVKLAEILIKLTIHLNIKIFINSHSSEFIEALQVYSIKNKVTGLNAYLAEEENEVTIFKDKTNEFGEIYRELGKGYDILDKVKMEIGN
ncbi:MAG: AAA family ATPase [Cetobacterium sp.]